ncbi:hypothetical protein [Nonomuraea sp. NPDC049480]|uniref:hypothetical protein n=1 Tax=Nonomuraea sp. NPDC049480 TaxID=3364353 RepID=UPI0037A12736
MIDPGLADQNVLVTGGAGGIGAADVRSSVRTLRSSIRVVAPHTPCAYSLVTRDMTSTWVTPSTQGTSRGIVCTMKS